MFKKRPALLSKTKYVEGLQCPKLLWYEYNRRELIPPPDPARQAIFDEGIKIGELARALFPDGITLARKGYPEDHDKQSRQALKERRPLFEAGFIADGGYALADILLPSGAGDWDLIEVKSSTSVKDEHLPDAAFQLLTYRAAGLDVRSCSLTHINNQYLRKGPINPRELFIKTDITANVEQLLPQTKNNLLKFRDLIAQPDEPKVPIGPQCNSPYKCPLKELCWASVPRHNSVFSFYRSEKLAFELMAKGITELNAVPADVELTDKQQIQLKSHRQGGAYIEQAGLQAFLNTLKYPLYFLDFETVGGGLPLYNLSRPYEQIPFQYSLQVVENPGAAPRNYSFIADGNDDPRPQILSRLYNLLKDSGSVVAYNASFETGVLERAAEIYPDYAEWAREIKGRVVDLIAPFRSFYYYHPRQEGSNSLKAVLPALTGLSYKEMEIADGSMASSQFYRITFGAGVTAEERQRTRAALEKYCSLDTQGMIDIIDVLRKSCVC